MHEQSWPDRQQTGTTQTGVPSECPVCRSADVTTTGRAVTAESYWRCVTCGEVWNVGRREPAHSTPYGRFRR
jgi:transposase-like protein